MRQAAAERCTRASQRRRQRSTMSVPWSRESESELEALTRPTTCPSHGVHGLPPLAPARTHVRGVTEYPARRVVVLRAGRPGGGRLSPLVGKRARGWSEERRGARRRARGGGAGCRRRLQVPGQARRLASDGLAQRGSGARRRDPDAHAARMGGVPARRGADGPRGGLYLTVIAHLR